MITGEPAQRKPWSIFAGSRQLQSARRSSLACPITSGKSPSHFSSSGRDAPIWLQSKVKTEHVRDVPSRLGTRWNVASATSKYCVITHSAPKADMKQRAASFWVLLPISWRSHYDPWLITVSRIEGVGCRD